MATAAAENNALGTAIAASEAYQQAIVDNAKAAAAVHRDTLNRVVALEARPSGIGRS